jgi:hypothetical protein
MRLSTRHVAREMGRGGGGTLSKHARIASNKTSAISKLTILTVHICALVSGEKPKLFVIVQEKEPAQIEGACSKEGAVQQKEQKRRNKK